MSYGKLWGIRFKEITKGFQDPCKGCRGILEPLLNRVIGCDIWLRMMGQEAIFLM